MGIGGSILAIMFLTRYLSPGDMGVYFLAASIITVVSGVGQFGLGRVAIRRISESVAVSVPGTAERFAIIVVKLGLAAAIISAIGLHEIVLPLLANIFTKSVELVSLRNQLALWVLAAILVALVGHIFRGFHDNRHASLVGGTFLPVALAVAYGTLLVLGVDASLAVVTTGSAVAAFAAAVLALVLLRSRLSAAVPAVAYGWKKLAIDAGPYWLNSAMFLVLAQADIWILSMFQSQEDVAVYGALKRLLIFSAIPVILILPVIAPTISELYAKKDTETLGRVLRAAGFVGAVPLLAIVVVLVLAPGFWLEMIYGEAYRSGAAALVILCLGYVLAIPFGIGSTALSMTDHQHAITIITLVTGVISLIAALHAAEHYGVVGVATVVAATIVMQRSLCWLVLRVLYGIRSDLASLDPQQIRHMIGSAVRVIRPGQRNK